MKQLGIVTQDVGRIKYLGDVCKKESWEASVLQSTEWKEANIFDFGRICQKSDLLFFDGFSPALGFLSRANMLDKDTKIMLKIYGPELLTEAIKSVPWKKVVKSWTVTPYYHRFAKEIQNSSKFLINISDIKRPYTPIPSVTLNLNLDSKKFCVFHQVSPEFDVFYLLDILKANPEYSCSIVGKTTNDAYKDLFLQLAEEQDIQKSRIEFYPDLAKDVVHDFLEEHPKVVSVRPDEVVFHNVRELIALGLTPYIRSTPISRTIFPESILFNDVPDFSKERDISSISSILDSNELDIIKSTLQEV